MRTEPLRMQGYKLLHYGAIELAVVEGNGIRIDLKLLQHTKEQLSVDIRKLRTQLESTDLWQVWHKRYGVRASITSREQLATILHEELGFKVGKQTESGRAATDEEALQKIDHPAIPKLVRLGKYEKALGTFLKGIEKEVVGDRLHPVFNLHIARTYRSSSDSPNFQNFPVRDKEVSKIIRSLFIPSPDSVLIENDFKGIEVALSSAYHHDPVFIDYISTPGKDMHRDMAAQIYCLKPEEVTKDIRYGAKNKFVFPQFYGDYYLACAKNLWEWIRLGNLKAPGDVPLKEHLKKHGIKRLGACDPEQEPKPHTFEKHLQDVENDFWNRRFKVYGQWRRNWYAQYLKRGYFDILTGFRVHGTFLRNAVTNYPIQGSAFHCLLWSLIQVNRKLRKHKMRSLVVGQIHDSLIGDVRVGELRDYLAIVEQVTTDELPKHWRWLTVSPEIEYEGCPPGGNWFQKTGFKFKGGRFVHPEKDTLTTKNAEAFLKTLGKEKK